MNRSADFEGRFGGHEDNIKVHFTGALRLEQTLVIVILPSGPDSQHTSLCGSSCPFLSGQKFKLSPNSPVANCLSMSFASMDL